MKVVIFGATGGIGSELQKLYKNEDLVAFGSHDLNFYDKDFKNNLSGFTDLKKILTDADIIISSAGRLGSNAESYDKVFDINFNPNWLFIKYFMENPPAEPKKFVMVGSMAYSHGRSDYVLYSASKAALFNLYLSASKYFLGSNLTIGIINPPAVRTKMVADLEGNFMSPEDCAKKIFDFIQTLETSKSLDLV